MSFLDKLAEEYAEAFRPHTTLNEEQRARFKKLVAPQIKGIAVVKGDTIAVTYTTADSMVIKVDLSVDFTHEIDDHDIDSLYNLAIQNDVPEKRRQLRKIFEG